MNLSPDATALLDFLRSQHQFNKSIYVYPKSADPAQQALADAAAELEGQGLLALDALIDGADVCLYWLTEMGEVVQ